MKKTLWYGWSMIPGYPIGMGGPPGGIKDMPSIGDIKMRAGGLTGVVEQGWLECNGQAVSRFGQYNLLFKAIGTSYGGGDGNTTFNVPDLRSRLPLGRGTGSGLTDRVLGDVTGAEAVFMQPSDLVQHRHGITDPGHNHTIIDPGHGHPGALFNSAGTEYLTTAGNKGIVGSGATPSVPSNATGVTVQAGDITNITQTDFYSPGVGGQTAMNKMPPCRVVAFVICYQA